LRSIFLEIISEIFLAGENVPYRLGIQNAIQPIITALHIFIYVCIINNLENAEAFVALIPFSSSLLQTTSIVYDV